MPHTYPQDSDGNALQRIADHGSDMSKPMFINFQVAVPDHAVAKTLATITYKLGYRVKIYRSPECSLPWTCECSTRMLATYDSVLAIQNELATLSKPLHGHPDGWATFGNGPNGQHDEP